MSSLSIVFAGTPAFGLPALQAISTSKHQLKAVYSQPDRPAGRGRKLQASEIKRWAQEQHIPVFQPLNFKTPEAVAELACLKPDVLVVIAYGLILPRRVLAIPRLGCVNVHASLLPSWRGASPIQHAILHGDEFSGVTIMQMDAGMDTGDMLLQVSCPLAPHETAATLHDKLAQMSIEPLLTTLDLLAENKAHPTPQDNALATYAPKIDKDDARINWATSAKLIDQQIRAFNPWPIAFTQLHDEMIRIHQAVIEPLGEPVLAGTILAIDKKGMLVATAKDAIRIQKLQFAGGKSISVSDWMNGGRYATYLHKVFQ